MSESRKIKKHKPFRHSSTFYRKRCKYNLTDLIDLPNNNQSNLSPEIIINQGTQASINETENNLTNNESSNDSSEAEFWLESDHDEVSDCVLGLIDGEEKKETSTDLLDSLRCWAAKNGISLAHLTELLQILSTHGVKNLPKDGRTLLKTPKQIEIKKIDGGEYWYYGIEKSLAQIELPNLPDEVKLNFHFDGLPVGKSTKKQFWPILMEIVNITGLSCVFIVAVYCGDSKPISADIFLNDFVTELNSLLESGFNNIQERHISIRINAIICDTPARAFLKCTVSHNAYDSCMRCIVHGIYDKGGRHISFPETDCLKRTDRDFRNKKYPEHHQVDKTSDEIVISPLEKLPIDMVRDVPIADSLHLIDLGIVKRCLVGWVRGSYNFRIKLFASQINDISLWLKDCNRFLPNDIHRSIRGLDHLSFWKASEYRTFLFYLGPIILKEHLSVETYKHFLLLFCAISLLSTNYYVSQENYLNAANQMLLDYIEMFISIYGADSISSNVHNLSHVVEDVRRFGCLPNIST